MNCISYGRLPFKLLGFVKYQVKRAFVTCLFDCTCGLESYIFPTSCLSVAISHLYGDNKLCLYHLQFCSLVYFLFLIFHPFKFFMCANCKHDSFRVICSGCPFFYINKIWDFFFFFFVFYFILFLTKQMGTHYWQKIIRFISMTISTVGYWQS